jgi:tetratricopeptide (TPR) repeat protein
VTSPLAVGSKNGQRIARSGNTRGRALDYLHRQRQTNRSEEESMRGRFISAGVLTIVAAISVTAQEASASFDRGCEAFARGRYVQAIAEFERAQIGPRRAEALYNEGVCRYELGRLEEAIRDYRAAIAAHDGDYPAALYALGVALDDAGRWREAEAAYRLALQRQPRYAEALFRLGLAALRRGDLERAELRFRRAVARAGRPFPAARNNLGVALARMGAVDEAAREFARAVEEANGYADAERNLAACRAARRERLRDRLAVARTEAIGGGSDRLRILDAPR